MYTACVSISEMMEMYAVMYVNGGGGFFITCKERSIWETVRQFIPCLCFFFFNVEIRSYTLIPLFRPGSVHNGLESRDNCG